MEGEKLRKGPTFWRLLYSVEEEDPKQGTQEYII